MKLRVSMALMIVAMGCLLLQAGAGAGDNKSQEKKDETKDVVVNGELINADLKDKVRTDCYCKTYTFKMTEGRTYQLDMKSPPGVLDSFLRLEDADGKQVSEDDDSGGNLDARIVFRATKTADFQIIATTFSPGLGKFTLTVKDTTK